jgi:hypothetical protein
MPLLISDKHTNKSVNGFSFADKANGFGISKGDNDYRENLKSVVGKPNTYGA